MTLDEVMDEEPTITAQQARREVERHGCSWTEFQAENGCSSSYNGWEVLCWLGY